MHDSSEAALLAEIERLINLTASRGSTSRCGAVDDDDRRQELWLQYVRAKPSYDPERAPVGPFFRPVFTRRLVSLDRAQAAAKRRPSRQISLHVTVQIGDDEHSELAAQVEERDGDARTGRVTRPAVEQCALCEDIRTARARLTPRQDRIVELLMDRCASDVARLLGIPRTTLQREVERICAIFEDAGLRHYLR